MRIILKLPYSTLYIYNIKFCVIVHWEVCLHVLNTKVERTTFPVAIRFPGSYTKLYLFTSFFGKLYEAITSFSKL